MRARLFFTLIIGARKTEKLCVRRQVHVIRIAEMFVPVRYEYERCDGSCSRREALDELVSATVAASSV